ncbi:hypothetical protein [Salinimicrobium sp. GXAS 041]|uniref:hypothetical protein n=1 Tax=Salinimicrobium sp. GXAS 041 TaxID=3400806 RepID=UPI003C77996A
MDTSSTLMGVGMLLIFIAPVAIYLMRQSSNKKSNRKHLILLAKQHNLKLSKIDFLPNLSLGLDEASGKLLVRYSGKENKNRCIDLNSYSSSVIAKSYSSNGSEPNNFDNISQISLRLKQNGKTSEEEDLIFFEKDRTSVLQKEEMMHAAEKWNDWIEKLLK